MKKTVKKSYESRTAFVKDKGDMASKGYWLREAKWEHDGIIATYKFYRQDRRK